MKRNVFGAFAIAGGLALWATIGAAAQGTATAATFDPSKDCTPDQQLKLETSLGVNSTEATAQLTELNAEATLGQAAIVASANAALAELTAENADEASDEDATSTLTLDAKTLAIKAAACQSIAELAAEYNATFAELKAELTQPEPTVNQPKPEKDDVEKDSERHETERDQPEQRQTQLRSTEREGND